MSGCERCGGKDHSTSGHDAAAAVVSADQAWDAADYHARVALPRERTERQGLLTFEHEPGSPYWLCTPQRSFAPKGLMLWDVGSLQLRAMTLGRDHALVSSCGLVPARWFAVQQSFADVVKALESGNEAAAWGTWKTVYPGILIQLEFDGPCDHIQALMWGLEVT